MFVAGAVMMVVSLAALTPIHTATPFAAFVAQLVLLGLGLGLIVPVMTSALLGGVDASRSGVASGALNTARQAGSTIGVALFGSLAAADLGTGLRQSIEISAVLALAVACLGVVGLAHTE